MAMPRFEGGTSFTISPAIWSVARCDVLEPGDGPQQRRLPAARGADEDDELARFDVEVDAVQDIRGCRRPC